MEVKMIEKLKDKLSEELEQVSRKPSMNAGDLEAINKLIISIEKLMKIEEMEGGQSQRNYSRDNMDRGSYNNGNSYGSYNDRNSYNDNSYNYDNGNSEARRGMHYVRGHYSRDDERMKLADMLQSRMQDDSLSSRDRDVLKRALEVL